MAMNSGDGRAMQERRNTPHGKVCKAISPSSPGETSKSLEFTRTTSPRAASPAAEREPQLESHSTYSLTKAMAMPPHEQPQPRHHARRPDTNTTSSIATNRWGPYSGAGDFASNMAVILAALLAALALALALNAAVRYLLRRARRSAAQTRRADTAHADPEKPPVEEHEAPPPLPVLVYSTSGTKLAGAAAECAICLTEFVDGDAVRVMPACGHGFHARCIERWLARGRRSSCPTCRAPAAAPAAAGTTSNTVTEGAIAIPIQRQQAEQAAAPSS